VKVSRVDPEIICLKNIFNKWVHAEDPLKLLRYWNEVHEIYT